MDELMCELIDKLKLNINFDNELDLVISKLYHLDTIDPDN